MIIFTEPLETDSTSIKSEAPETEFGNINYTMSKLFLVIRLFMQKL